MIEHGCVALNTGQSSSALNQWKRLVVLKSTD
jgi:hypothetical protein